jgi:preprotein translocase subunit SecE
MLGKLHSYLGEAIAEMKKVIWPTREQTVNYTLLVIALSVGVAVLFGVLDYIFNLGLEQLIK